MIRIDQYFLYAQPTDMRSGVDRLLSLVITAHGRAMPHTAYLFANQSKSRLKVLIHDEFGVWLSLNSGVYLCPLIMTFSYAQILAGSCPR